MPNTRISTGGGGSLMQSDPKQLGGTKIGPKMAGGGKVKSASARADGCAIRGKTRGKMV